MFSGYQWLALLFNYITTDLQALTLVGLTREDPVLDSLAVLHLDNQLYLIGIECSESHR